MDTLIIVRHAKAESAHLHVRDFDRPLTWQGADDARSAAVRISSDYPHIACIVASPARRTQITAEIIGQQFGITEEAIRFDERIYEAELVTLLEIVKELDAVPGNVVLVGHNPGVLELSYMLTNGHVTSMPTSAVVCIDRSTI
ncbi:MAG: SixA phosphatase family protein [Candidatus Kapaibacterium sp.]